MLADVVEFLVCPLCGKDLVLIDRSLRCATKHVFDVARQGYVNLLPGDAHVGTADTLEMVEARDTLLKSGHYASIARKVAETAVSSLGENAGGCVVDVGAGTGYYLAGVLDRLPNCVGLALDISKFALRRAARAHARLGAVVCNAWDLLPVRTGAAALVLDIFAPRNPSEFRRILKPGGALIIVTPTNRHLQELIPTLDLLKVDEDKKERLDDKLGAHFAQVDAASHEESLSLSHEEIATLVWMSPSAWHTDKAALDARIRELTEPVSTTVSVVISVYRKRDVGSLVNLS